MNLANHLANNVETLGISHPKNVRQDKNQIEKAIKHF